jgi:peroxiredoxin
MLRSFTKVKGFRNTSTLFNYSTQKFPSVTEPSVTLYDIERNKVNTGDLFSKGRHIIIGIPGAFTPVCSNKHVPVGNSFLLA